MAEAWPGWRSQKEKDHVYAQFDEARQCIASSRSEAAQAKGTAQVAEMLNPPCQARASANVSSRSSCWQSANRHGPGTRGKSPGRRAAIRAERAESDRLRRDCRLNIWRERMKRVVSWVIAVS